MDDCYFFVVDFAFATGGFFMDDFAFAADFGLEDAPPDGADLVPQQEGSLRFFSSTLHLPCQRRDARE